MKQLIRLVYSSDHADPHVDLEGALEIERSSQKNNLFNGITGVLYFNESGFLQVLEGEMQVVTQTFGRVSRDNRHQNVRLIETIPIKKQIFSLWDLRLVSPSLIPENMLDYFYFKYGRDERDEIPIPDDSFQAISLLYDLQKVALYSEHKATGEG